MATMTQKCPCCGGDEFKPHCERAELPPNAHPDARKAPPCRWVACRGCRAVLEPLSGRHTAPDGRDHLASCYNPGNVPNSPE